MTIFNSPLAQFDVICILPLFWGKYEVSLTNLSLTAIITLFLGIFILYIFFNEQLIPRNWQIILESLFLFILINIKQQIKFENTIYFPLIPYIYISFKFLHLYFIQIIFFKKWFDYDLMASFNMFLIKKNIIKQDLIFNNKSLRNYAIQTKYLNPINKFSQHPLSTEFFYTVDNKKYIVQSNITHSPYVWFNGEYIEGKRVGKDQDGKDIFLVFFDIKISFIENIQDLENFINNIKKNHIDYNISINNDELSYNIHQYLTDKLRKDGIEVQTIITGHETTTQMIDRMSYVKNTFNKDD
jgi:hypothetical protein